MRHLKSSDGDAASTKDPAQIEYGTISDVAPVLPRIDAAAERKLVQKLDLLVMVIIFFMYFFNSIDRSNLGNAKTDGMDVDLGFVNNQYSILVMVFYVPFCGLCLPANLVTRKFEPKFFLVGFMLCWGIMAMICAACKNFAQILAVRILLGIAEAGFAPCSMFYMSTFYTRGELATRFAIWYSSTVLSSAVSGLISYGVFQIRGALHGWQYLFLIEGGLTVVIALLASVILPKNPWTCRWLTQAEKELCVLRGERDSTSDVGSAWDFREGMQPFKSWQVYVSIHPAHHFPPLPPPPPQPSPNILNSPLLPLLHSYAWALIGLCYGTSGSAVGSFLPQIVQLMGFSTLKTNLYTVAPNVVGALVLLCTARSSDVLRERSAHLVFALLVTFAGWVILLALDEPAAHVPVAYFACFLLCAGAMTPTVLFHSWHASNMCTENGRIYVMSFLTGAANSGGIVASMTFRAEDAPRYLPFLGTAAGFEGVGMVLILALRWWMVWDNARRDRVVGRKLVSKDVRLSELVGGTKDVRWRWFV
ncbi:high-affinity nicotinic acid transporter [Diplodia corticola]|uniref:High-affinity nicotinic acid transporter n=1 Tax=Diplodia corticola TaxID=236234 RepID=A0A1J9QZM7_9PEZI|nr:high-affinity nicotinic acid transporter [Diplodia corticola]OJD33442.1 high-affinity nicotinic acid transporter [Diplodia corticola]